MPSAYLLVSHGSRDPRSQVAVVQLAELLQQRFVARSREARLASSRYKAVSSVVVPAAVAPLVGTATLELAPIPLHEQIQQFGNRAFASGYQHLVILPLFLLPGVHVMEDIPAEIALAEKALSPNVSLTLCAHVGTHPQMGRLLLAQNAPINTESKILLSHGSRRQGGNQPVEALAAKLAALPAYWSMSPTLEERVAAFVDAGQQSVTILPYFLFPGGITDAIAQAVEQLQQRFPSVQFNLSSPIGVSCDLADLVLDLLTLNPYTHF